MGSAGEAVEPQARRRARAQPGRWAETLAVPVGQTVALGDEGVDAQSVNERQRAAGPRGVAQGYGRIRLARSLSIATRPFRLVEEQTLERRAGHWAFDRLGLAPWRSRFCRTGPSSEVFSGSNRLANGVNTYFAYTCMVV